MISLKISKAKKDDSKTISTLIIALLKELEPQAKEEINNIDFEKIASSLLGESKILVFIAYDDIKPIGLITLHECAAIYAGGIFGEISELYVKPNYRSCGIGKKLLDTVEAEAHIRNWLRIEVGTPNKEEWSKTIQFYKNSNFQEIGPRLRKKL